LLLAGKARLASGDIPGSIESLDRARDLYRGISFRFQEAEAGLLLAQARLLSGDKKGAGQAAGESLELVERHGYVNMARRIASSGPLLELVAGLGGSAPGIVGAPPMPTRSTTIGGALGGYDLTVNMLGRVEVYRDELRQIPASAWVLKKALKILCYLGSARDHRATKDRIIDTFWKDARPGLIDKNFHPTISYLRKALNFSHNVSKNFILFEKGAYLLNPAYKWRIDTDVFERAVAEARRRTRTGDRKGALLSYREAIDLYRGEFLEEDYDEWVEAPRSRYRDLLGAALVEAGALHRAAGSLEETRECYERLCRLDAMSEEASCLLMETLAAMGNRAAVEREFARLTEELKRELGLSPMAETRATYQKAISGSSAGKGPKPSGR
jgi:DNA-binding SARP family transcriptional activator